jgi:hypothetical protein
MDNVSAGNLGSVVSATIIDDELLSLAVLDLNGAGSDEPGHRTMSL